MLYTTAQGQTRRIAQRFADKLRDYELEVDVRDLAALPEHFSIGDWDGVAIGASVHGGHHLKAAAEFARHSQYGVFERILMRLIMRRKGHGDVKWDQEYTDWDAVTAFADDFAPAVAQRGAHPAAGVA